MPDVAFTILDDGAATAVEARIAGDRVRLSREALTRALGWEVTDEGLCREGLCVPVPPGAALDTPEGIDLAALAADLCPE